MLASASPSQMAVLASLTEISIYQDGNIVWPIPTVKIKWFHSSAAFAKLEHQGGTLADCRWGGPKGGHCDNGETLNC
jgi:hypothetical protein